MLLNPIEKALFFRDSKRWLESGAAGQIWTVDLAITNGVLYPWATAAERMNLLSNFGGTMPYAWHIKQVYLMMLSTWDIVKFYNPLNQTFTKYLKDG